MIRHFQFGWFLPGVLIILANTSVLAQTCAGGSTNYMSRWYYSPIYYNSY